MQLLLNTPCAQVASRLACAAKDQDRGHSGERWGTPEAAALKALSCPMNHPQVKGHPPFNPTPLFSSPPLPPVLCTPSHTSGIYDPASAIPFRSVAVGREVLNNDLLLHRLNRAASLRWVPVPACAFDCLWFRGMRGGGGGEGSEEGLLRRLTCTAMFM